MNRTYTAAELEADRRGITIHNISPAHGLWGLYLHHFRVILIRPDLGPIQRAWTLWHELGHAHHGHTETTRRAEAQADIYAAEHLVTPEAIASAALPGMTCQEVAAAIGVLPRAVEIWAEHHTIPITHLEYAS